MAGDGTLEPHYTSKEVADIFGYEERTVRGWFNNGTLKGICINGQWRAAHSVLLTMQAAGAEMKPTAHLRKIISKPPVPRQDLAREPAKRKAKPA